MQDVHVRKWKAQGKIYYISNNVKRNNEREILEMPTNPLPAASQLQVIRDGQVMLRIRLPGRAGTREKQIKRPSNHIFTTGGMRMPDYHCHHRVSVSANQAGALSND